MHCLLAMCNALGDSCTLQPVDNLASNGTLQALRRPPLYARCKKPLLDIEPRL